MFIGLTNYQRNVRRELHIDDPSKALAELEQYDVDEAIQQLENCPEDLRQWEWYFVHQLCQPLLTLNGVNAAHQSRR